MDIIEKINYLNSLVNGTLSFTSYDNFWELTSYKKNSLFSLKGSIDSIEEESFEKCINEAIRAVSDLENIPKDLRNNSSML